MSDIAQILGVASKPMSASVAPAPAAPPPAQHPGYQPPKGMQALPKEVMHLLGSGSNKASGASLTIELPMRVPAFSIHKPAASAAASDESAMDTGADVVKVGNKFISVAKPARKWVWAPFSSSARTDGAIFHHWVRANVEYPDYPYARFDIHLDPITYNDDEYKSYLQSDKWSRSQTDFLLELARRFELRWPIVHDRWIEAFGIDCAEKIEDLQHRYYSVASKLNSARIAQEAAKEVQHLVTRQPESRENGTSEALLMETAAARALASTELEQQPPIPNIGTGTSNKVFDIDYERNRREHMEALWNRPKADEMEEIEVRKELKLVEAQLRKMKKSGRHVLAATKGKAVGGGAGAGNGLPGIDPSALDQAFGSTAPKSVPQIPYVQSGRLAPPAIGGAAGLNKSLLSRMEEMLVQLRVPAKPLPTKRVCDMYDQVRRDTLSLLVCQKQVIQKEGAIQSKRLRLAKMGGEGRVVDEETLLGITPSVPVASSPVARASKSKPAGSGGKAKAVSGSISGVAAGAGKQGKGMKPHLAPVSAASVGSPQPGAAVPAAKAGEKVKDPTKSASKKTTKRKRKAEPMTGSIALPSGSEIANPIAGPVAAPVATSAAPRPTDVTQQAKKRPKKAVIQE